MPSTHRHLPFSEPRVLPGPHIANAPSGILPSATHGASSYLRARRIQAACRRDQAASAVTLAFRAEPEELELVTDLLKSVMACDPALEAGRNTVFDLNDERAPTADEMVVMMAAGLIIGDFEAGAAVAQVDALDEAECFEAIQRAIDGRQVTQARAQGGGDFLWCEGA
jgi:hypothetical protein